MLRIEPLACRLASALTGVFSSPWLRSVGNSRLRIPGRNVDYSSKGMMTTFSCESSSERKDRLPDSAWHPQSPPVIRVLRRARWRSAY